MATNDKIRCPRCGAFAVEQTKVFFRIFSNFNYPQPDGVCRNCGAPYWAKAERVIIAIGGAITKKWDWRDHIDDFFPRKKKKKWRKRRPRHVSKMSRV